MKVNCVIGIDPGANGGIAVYRPGEPMVLAKMPKELSRLKDFLTYYKQIASPIIFLEKVSVRPDDVSVAGNAAQMGKLFRIQKMIANYEQLKTTIAFLGIPYVTVHPMKWQNGLKLRINRKGFHEEKADRKRRYKDVAADLYPGMKQTLWSADATLIMHYGRYVLANDIQQVLSKLPDEQRKTLF